MKEHPIFFNGPMVRAIIEGRKTQTRRVVKLQKEPTDYPQANGVKFVQIAGKQYWWNSQPSHPAHVTKACPYGKPGDRLWVRETWQHSNFPLGPFMESCDVFYRADYLDDPLGPDLELSGDGIRRKWKPSIHMPRAASRIILEIVSVRVERLKDISEADAFSEGIERLEKHSFTAGPAKPLGTFKGLDAWSDAHPFWTSAVSAYESLWESINGPGSWEANPWVWVIEFRRITDAA